MDKTQFAQVDISNLVSQSAQAMTGLIGQKRNDIYFGTMFQLNLLLL
ncbi:hypothetical protein [Xanthocytophaga agilis]|uniref:Uncharacterized protein n=1 Tax=Xanthocytophaga agilis TaxID=3048010 RepID=A0AAE3RE28_9BACT|nr:hypothetical protein [Xanthocytophaga agilis]MDJ1506437.1 hypothetical protein [Xanthocytophaga agilis]